jgi:periplasmic protein TonB
MNALQTAVSTLDDEPTPPRSRATWATAALVALAIHGTAAALTLYSLHSAAIDLGAPGLVIDVELSSPRHDPTDLPIGPDTAASAPAPEVVEQKTVIEQTKLPKDVLTDTDDPERAATRDDVEKPNDQNPKITAVQAMPSNASVATEDTVVPTLDSAQVSPRSTVPSLGTGESAVRERVTWEKELAAHFDKYKRYPAERAAQAAEVVVSFVLDRMGHIVSWRIVKSSGDTAFDNEALSMLQRSDPVPPPPSLVADQGLSFTLPVIFHVKPQK